MGRSNSPEIPKAAKAWTLWQVTTTTRRNKESGRTYPANVTKRLTGDADEEGTVADTWPVAEFSVKAIRQRYGAGRFRVDWYDNKGAKLGDWKFNLAAPEPRAAAASPARAAADDGDEADEGQLMARLPTTPLGWLMMMQAREERAERRREAQVRDERERIRQEADDRAQRDRDFLREVAGARAVTAAAAPAAPGLDMAREFSLLKRELALTIREQHMQLRAELAANQPEEDGPETPADALNSAGVELIEGVGEALGELGPDVLGAVRKWLRAKGVEDSPENLEALVERAALEVAEMKKTNGAAAHE